MRIRRSEEKDIPAVMEVIEDAREALRLAGIPQWQNGYPNADSIRNDIQNGYAWLMEEDGNIIGTCAIIAGRDPNYTLIEDGEWLNDEDYAVVHRIAVRTSCKGRRLAGRFFDHAEQIARSCGYRNARADTHELNQSMQKALKHAGFVPCGRVYMADGAPRTGFQKVLEQEGK
ncbi:MAG: GNAT family N-acetyltransferase [Solobacterium sp.]|nr:GNAT family N-acetyltransferase [Solobacterium sp.]